MGPRLVWQVVCSAARCVPSLLRASISPILPTYRLSTVGQILLYLPLTLSVLGEPAFLANSLLLFMHSLIHGTLALFSNHSPILSVLQPPMHPFILLISFNVFSAAAVSPIVTSAAAWWGTLLRFSSPGFITMEGLCSLLVAQKLGQQGKLIVGEGREEYQLGLLIGAAVTYVASAWWIVVVSPSWLRTF